MKRYAQLIGNVVSCNIYPMELYETEDAKKLNSMFAPGISFVEIPEDSPVDTGWTYNEETGEFTEPEPEPEPEQEPTTEELILAKVGQVELDLINKDELDLERDIMLMEMALVLL